MGKYGRQETEAPKKKSKKFNWNPFSHAPKPVRTGLGVTLNVLDKGGQAVRSGLAAFAEDPLGASSVPGAGSPSVVITVNAMDVDSFRRVLPELLEEILK